MRLNCDLCAALRALARLREYRAVARGNLLDLDLAVLNHQRTLQKMHQELFQLVNRPGAMGQTFAVGEYIISLLNIAASFKWSAVGIVASAIEAGVSASDFYVARYYTEPAADEHRKLIQQVRQGLDRLQPMVVPWAHYTTQLDLDLDDLIERILEKCLLKDCGGRRTAFSRQAMEQAGLMEVALRGNHSPSGTVFEETVTANVADLPPQSPAESSLYVPEDDRTQRMLITGVQEEPGGGVSGTIFPKQASCVAGVRPVWMLSTQACQA